MPFSKADFSARLRDIEKLLGYLRGNENAYKYLDELRTSSDSEPNWFTNSDEITFKNIVKLDAGYKFPCPDGRFTFPPEYGGWGMFTFSSESRPITEADERKLVADIQRGADQSWENGFAWSQGIAGYAESVCDQFTKPDVGALAEAVRDVQRRVIEPFKATWDDDWARLGGMETVWTSPAGRSFQEFYQNVNENLSREAWYAGSVAVGFALATQGIAGTQQGAMEYLDAVKEQLEVQLERWVQWGSQPSGYGDSSNVPVGDVFTIFKNVVAIGATFFKDQLNAVKMTVDLLGNVGAIVTGVDNLTPDAVPSKYVDIPVQSAEEAYTAFVSTLRTDYLEAYQDGMDSLQSGRVPGEVPDPNNLSNEVFSGDNLLDSREDDPNDDLTGVPPESLVGENDTYS